MSTSVTSDEITLHHTEDGSGHVVNIDQPGQVAEAPLEFLAGPA